VDGKGLIMCGIAGVIKRQDFLCSTQVLDRMRDHVSHRGPNGKGSSFFSRAHGSLAPCKPSGDDWEVGIGNRRLSILDTSSAGSQPMHYGDYYWTTFNGEIYNYIELRHELKLAGHHFTSGCDTEVILKAYAEWGTDCFARFRGMWGVIIVDLLRDEAIVSRDRLGIKPVYLWRTGQMVAIASEIKQLLALPGFRPTVNTAVASEYLSSGYENDAETFFSGVTPLPTATWIRVSLKTLAEIERQEYWKLRRIPIAVEDAHHATELFKYQFERSLRIHLRSDVPLGCSLSGGLDSSAIAVKGADLIGESNRLKTFTAAFPRFKHNEAGYADMVNTAVRGQSHISHPSPRGFLEDLDRFTWIHDEPVGSLSVYAGYCVARNMQSAGIPVSLSGQGGDEVLGGYWQSYALHLKDLATSGRLLQLSGHCIGALAGGGNPNMLVQLPAMAMRYLTRRYPMLKFRNAARTNSLLRARNIEARDRRIQELRVFFLPRLLKWEDRNSMAFSVEGRYPFLDHELIETCLSFSSRVLYHRGWTKLPLRCSFGGSLPDAVVWRREKVGYETPQVEWMNNALRPTFEKWLQRDSPAWQFLDVNAVRKVAKRLWSGTVGARQLEASMTLFRVFMFDRWMRCFSVAV
jgi:asparagine synthase (glutamine-hydrolysing)